MVSEELLHMSCYKSNAIGGLHGVRTVATYELLQEQCYWRTTWCQKSCYICNNLIIAYDAFC